MRKPENLVELAIAYQEGVVYIFFCWELNQFERIQDRSLTYPWFLIAHLQVSATPTEIWFPLEIWRSLDSTNSYKR